MADIEALAGKIRERLEQSRQEIHQRQLQADKEMKCLMEKRARFTSEAHHLLIRAIYPRMEELSRNFDNSRLIDTDRESDLHCICIFSHTDTYPATVTLDLSLCPDDNYDSLECHYSLEILPVLMEYKKYDERSFLLDKLNEDDIGEWVEARILDFIDTYLQLETHPLYQKNNLVTDPVCGMKIPLVQAAGSMVSNGRTVFFCSDACEEEFRKENP